MQLTTAPGILTDLRLALHTLRLPFSLFVIAFSLTTTLLLFILLAWGMWSLVTATNIITIKWLEGMAGVGGALLVLVAGWFLFPATATALAGLFLESLADRIEQQQYEGLPAPRQISLTEQLRGAYRALIRALGLNAAVLPFYFIPGLNLLAYFAVNGQLLAREYFFTVALRHVTLEQAQDLFYTHRWRFWRRGALIAGLFIIPGVNLLAPILATALMTHTLWRKGDGMLRQSLALQTPNVLPNPS